MTTIQILTQLVLPIVLALMMLAMGLSLTLNDFRRIIRYPKAALLGIVMQLLLLPLIAWSLILIIKTFIPLSLELSQLLFLGLLILAACPGGATSNVISYLAGGDVALSISMTAIVSLLVPFVIPISLAYQFSWLGMGGEVIALYLPFAKTVMPLLLVTVFPVVLGMTLRHYWTNAIIKWEPLVGKVTGLIFVCLILALIVVQWTKLQDMGIGIALLCLSLCTFSMLVAYAIAGFTGLQYKIKKTLVIEVGFQNAGTGMFIAAVLLDSPSLALVPLMYGLVMNLPALMLIVINRQLNKVRA
ncbi:MAG: bile acid:sodium symporter family protein [Oleispira sp.]|nr:bile acid:sodium symporter family protein [Oleispira sp.]MBL4882825.1 bile acid:sodium symporter family protein [Oleispira sp.]